MILALNLGQIVGISIASSILVFLAFMIVRTLLARPEKVIEIDSSLPQVDRNRVTELLSKAVQFETVTLIDNIGDGTVFLDYQKFLEESFPLIMEKAVKKNVNEYSALYIYPGKNKDLAPVAILAHQDVVPAEDQVEEWDFPPFSGAISDGYVYGRGSQDMKSQMIAELEGLELLLKNGHEIDRSIYFCFGHDEERKGTYGNKVIVEQFIEEGIRFDYVLDEGGSILDGKILGIDKEIALIGTCEKGYLDLFLEVDQTSGHSSTPTRRTAVGILAKAVYKIEKNQMPTRWAQPVKDMFDSLAPYMNPLFKFAAVNRDMLTMILRPGLAIASPFTASVVKTTFAPTQLFGSESPNTLPSTAKVSINCRLITGDTIEDVLRHIKKYTKGIKVTVMDSATNPSPVSSSSAPQYNQVSKSIKQVFENIIVAPYIFIATSDSKYYHAVSDNVYRFTPFLKEEDDANRIHGVNERQDINMLVKGVEFFYKLYENTCINKSTEEA